MYGGRHRRSIQRTVDASSAVSGGLRSRRRRLNVDEVILGKSTGSTPRQAARVGERGGRGLCRQARPDCPRAFARKADVSVRTLQRTRRER